MVQIFTDGAAMGNPGKAAIGIIIKDNEHHITSTYAHYIDIKDTQQAEFIAVIYALKLAKQQQYHSVILHTDSKTVVDSIDKQYIKQTVYRPLLLEIITLMANFELCFIKWIARQDNKAADTLAKNALQTQQYDEKIKALDI